MSVDETKWDDVWKLICDVRKVQMEWIERWDLVRAAEGDSEAKKVFSDPDSPLCLDWSKDLAEIRTQVTQL
jgi:hypothetical protein